LKKLAFLFPFLIAGTGIFTQKQGQNDQATPSFP